MTNPLKSSLFLLLALISIPRMMLEDITRQPIIEFDVIHKKIADKLIDYIVEIENELRKNRESNERELEYD